MMKPSFTTSCGEKIPVFIDVRRGLRNITIRPKTIPKREIHISKPWLVPTPSALRFLKQKGAWLEQVYSCAPKKQKIQDGDTIEFLGKTVTIRHDASKKSNYYDGDVLIVGGDAEMLERRIRDVIKAEFLAEIKKIIKETPLEFHPKRLSIKDTTSRWGSCSSSGVISFSWRLALAPYEIMRYVIMHELAHQAHMDHSPQFWQQVRVLYGPGVERAKNWLAKHGETLHRYF